MPRVRTRVTLAAALLGAASSGVWSSASLGQTRPSATAAADPAAAARARFNEGVALAKKQQWQEAHVAFAEAWKLKKHPQIALNLGRAEMRIGKNRDAFAHLSYVVDEAETAEADRALARGWLAELDKKVGRLAITVDTTGAEVLVNGVSQGKSPLEGNVIVDPGKHEIEVRRGSEVERRIVEVTAGATAEVKLVQEAKAEDTRGEQGPRLPPTQVVVVGDRPPAWRTPALIGGSALAAGGLIVGGVFLGLSLDRAGAKEQAAKEPHGFEAEVLAAEDEAAFKNVMLWSFVGAGVALAGTATLFFLTRAPAKPAVQGAVSFGMGGASIVIRGEL